MHISQVELVELSVLLDPFCEQEEMDDSADSTQLVFHSQDNCCAIMVDSTQRFKAVWQRYLNNHIKSRSYLCRLGLNSDANYEK